MLKDLDPNVYDIACIQEPYLNPVKLANASNLRQYWDVIYPTDHHTSPERSQVIMLVNKKLSKNDWHTVTIKSSNIMAIELTGNFGKVRMYNIYNACDHDDTLIFLERHMATERNARQTQRIAKGEQGAKPEYIMWMGDFNRHHPLWEPQHNTHLFTAANLNAAAVLINLLSMYNLVQILPLGLTTLEASNTRNLTRPDNMFCSMQMEQRISKCSVEQHLRPVVTDHFPIITVIDIEPERVMHTPKHNYHATDWEEFREHLANKLSNILPPDELTTHVQFQEALTTLTRCISETVEAKVPKSNPSPYAKRWWSKELEAERKGVRKLARDSRKHLARRNDPVHEEYRVAQNKLAENIK
jgi:endonuclease/exonuclease/phosphatase family metal-dependent hydrolase